MADQTTIDLTLHGVPKEVFLKISQSASEVGQSVEDYVIDQATRASDTDPIKPSLPFTGSEFVETWSGAFEIPDQETIDNDPRLKAILERAPKAKPS